MIADRNMLHGDEEADCEVLLIDIVACRHQGTVVLRPRRDELVAPYEPLPEPFNCGVGVGEVLSESLADVATRWVRSGGTRITISRLQVETYIDVNPARDTVALDVVRELGDMVHTPSRPLTTIAQLLPEPAQ